MRTELGARSNSIGTNALASSIVLVCRRRSPDAPAATRREFLTALRSELPDALRLLQTGNVAPVDLAQAAIGPGMAVYTRYARVLDAAGKRDGCSTVGADQRPSRGAPRTRCSVRFQRPLQRSLGERETLDGRSRLQQWLDRRRWAPRGCGEACGVLDTEHAHRREPDLLRSRRLAPSWSSGVRPRGSTATPSSSSPRTRRGCRTSTRRSASTWLGVDSRRARAVRLVASPR